jgi:hypothetical protein
MSGRAVGCFLQYSEYTPFDFVRQVILLLGYIHLLFQQLPLAIL